MGTLIRPTALERHAGFFDANGDGFVTIAETRARLGDLGLPAPLALFFSLLVNGFLGYLTRGRFSLEIEVKNIHRGKHPFDTDTFDEDGAFVQRRFDDIFARSAEPRDRVTEEELVKVLEWRGDPDRPFGLAGSFLSKSFAMLEVRVLFCLASDCKKGPNGAISRKTMQRFFDGKLFYLLARRRRIKLTLGEIEG
ncbi:MAG TPA: caleosin family protein [Polyangiaceae bacterium]|nr:caleosin family protein [Polyangiaceae bacterium]